MGGIEKLTRFQYHFDDVLVEVPTGCLASFPMEDKDIHVGGQLSSFGGVAALPLIPPLSGFNF